VLLGKTKKPQKIDDEEWEEMDAKAAHVIHLNLPHEVINNVIDEENVEKIWQKLEYLYDEKIDE
jgi:hypothetical protein